MNRILDYKTKWQTETGSGHVTSEEDKVATHASACLVLCKVRAPPVWGISNSCNHSVSVHINVPAILLRPFSL